MRVITRSVKEKLPEKLVNIIWDFHEQAYYGIEKDEYQFAKVATSEGTTTLRMWQEVPPSIKMKIIPYFDAVEVWIIKDDDVETMLLSDDY